jgi:hypothetical protein
MLSTDFSSIVGVVMEGPDFSSIVAAECGTFRLLNGFDDVMVLPYDRDLACRLQMFGEVRMFDRLVSEVCEPSATIHTPVVIKSPAMALKFPDF